MTQLPPEHPANPPGLLRPALIALIMVVLFIGSVVIGQRLGAPRSSSPTVPVTQPAVAPAPPSYAIAQAPAVAAAAPPPPATEDPDAEHAKTAEQLKDAGGVPAAAISAGLGVDRHRTINGWDVVLSADALLPIAPGLYALVVSGPSVDYCDACTGSGGVVYLTKAGDAYTKTGEWLGVLNGEPYGERPDYTTTVGDQTMLHVSTSESHQGCGVTTQQDVVLLPEGPKALPSTKRDDPPGCD